MLRSVTPADSPALLSLARATGLFTPQEADVLLGETLEDLHAGRLGEGHEARVWIDDASGTPAGWAYFAPTPKADGVWDVWWIGVDPTRQQAGVGGALLGSIEETIQAAGGRVLVIETSTGDALAKARRFYAGRGYMQCGRIPDFYADGDDKIIFAKRLGGCAPPPR